MEEYNCLPTETLNDSETPHSEIGQQAKKEKAGGS